MASFLCFHKCDWCGRWVILRLAWVYKDNQEYCKQACADKATIVMDDGGRKGWGQ